MSDLLDRALRLFRRSGRPRGASPRAGVDLQASAARLRAALLAGRTVAWEWDLRTDRVVRTENAPGLLGLPVDSDAHEGGAFADAIHPDDRERVAASVEQALVTGLPAACEFRLQRPDGSELWVLDDGQFEVDVEGRPIRMRGILRDITERKLLEERLAFVADRAPTLIAHIDAGERYVFVNRPYAERYGRQAEEVVGRPVREVVGPDVYAALEEHLRAALDGYGDLIWEGAEGEEHFQYRAVLDRAPEGKVRGLLVVLTDITERKRGEAELERARQEAEAANRAKDEFLATLSHELRTPLNAILGWSRMLVGGQLDAETAGRALDIIQRNALAQAQLVDDLLDVARITTGKMRLDLRPVDLVSVIERALEAVEPSAEAKGVRMESALDPRAGPVMGDSERLQQVVWNLLTNAVKFTGRGGRVQVMLGRVGAQVEIRVSDTGVGIAPALLPHIFDRFRQGVSMSPRPQRGLGIGLALVKHLVEQHGGSVEADSEGEGAGATFLITLPVMAHPIPTPDDRARAPGALAPSLASSLRGVRLLVVEDEPDALEMLAQILRQAGAEVREASSAREALAVLSSWQPDVLVSDIEMPEQNGYLLMREVRALASDCRNIPAVAVTAYARSEDRVRALAAGFSSHVPKPVEPVELVTVVSAVAGRLRP